MQVIRLDTESGLFVKSSPYQTCLSVEVRTQRRRGRPPLLCEAVDLGCVGLVLVNTFYLFLFFQYVLSICRNTLCNTRFPLGYATISLKSTFKMESTTDTSTDATVTHASPAPPKMPEPSMVRNEQIVPIRQYGHLFEERNTNIQDGAKPYTVRIVSKHLRSARASSV